MAKANKTQATVLSVEHYLNTIQDPTRQAQCKTLCQLMQTVTGQTPVMWGSSMVGFGSYHYTYDSGHSGSMFRLGFAARKNDLTVYIVNGFGRYSEQLHKLGKHTLGKSCLYLKSLDAVNLRALQDLIQASWQDTQVWADHGYTQSAQERLA